MDMPTAQSLRLPQRLSALRAPLEQFLSAAVGFVMSGASILLAAAPFGVAWAGAAPPDYAVSATLGAMGGYLMLSAGSGTLRYLAALVLLFGLRWALGFIPKSRIQFYTPLLAALAIAVTGLAVVLSEPSTVYAYALVGCEAAITATAGMLFVKAGRSLQEGAPLTRANGVCTGVGLAVLYMGFSAFQIGGFSPARMLAFYCLLLCGCCLSTGAGCAAAIAAGLVAALAGQPQLLAVYCAAGLAAGVFAPLGRAGSCVSMSAGAVLALLAQRPESPSAVLLALECAGASALFLLTPGEAVQKLGFIRNEGTASGEMLRRVVVARLARMGEALSGIGSLTGEIAKQLETIKGENGDELLGSACAEVCRSCNDSPRCWQSSYHDTADAIEHAFAAVRSGGAASADDLPDHFTCRRKSQLLEAINARGETVRARRAQRRQAAQLRSVTSDQFDGMSLLLSSLSDQLVRYACAPAQAGDSAERILRARCGELEHVCCYLDGDGRIGILAELPVYKSARLTGPEIAAELSEAVGQELGPPEEDQRAGLTRLTWTARAPFGIETAFLQRAANRNRFCGDSCRAIGEAHGRAVLLLSDGMGIGSPAAIDATLCTDLLDRLLTAGSDFGAALRLVNAALLSGGGEERLCTVDAAILDLFTCRLDLFKAGAAPTYILRQGRAAVVETPSLPAGILDGAQAEHTVLTLAEGDLIVMVSDGLTDSGGGWIPSQLVSLAQRPLERLCEELLKTAADRRIDGHEDDMTVLAARIIRT